MIDNHVGQMPRTIGYWKNHASSNKSNGGQAPVLDQMLYKATRRITPSDRHAVAAGGMYPATTPARREREGSLQPAQQSDDHKNKKMASDPCFNLAAQLMGYRLNQPFGAWPNNVAAAAADYAQAMLFAENFNGCTHDQAPRRRPRT